MPAFTNRLIHETSPYLLQHAHNPVDWFPWGEEALAKAREENKPILVSIGYAACHWCHVMERESFEDEATAGLMNTHFINIKIDREERPDLDHIYMDAVQAMTGSGGWPLNVFLTPDAKPFYGGTYFPPVQAHNRPSWKDVMLGIAKAFRERRSEIDAQAENLTEHLLRANAFGGETKAGENNEFTASQLDTLFANIMKTADKEEGGFGRAPKFPQTFTIQNLLRYHHYTGNVHALNQACLSLDKMICGGIYDHLGGGFSRYSTDNEWLAPHFEKMLYDNALLVTVLSEAWQITANPLYARTIRETLAFVAREMRSPEGGFYAALDADSEGEEGRFYVWDKDELDELLGPQSAIFCRYYNVSAMGNWESRNILHLKQQAGAFAKKEGMLEAEWLEKLEVMKLRVLERRSERVRPQLDDKVLLGWNAMMCSACCRAYAALGDEAFLEMALSNMQFLQKAFFQPDGSCRHTWKAGESRFPAFLDDYASTIEALILLQEITGETNWLLQAEQLTNYVTEHFSEAETGFFYFTHKDQKDVIIRKKEVYDGATPSGNAAMAMQLYYLSLALDRPEWREWADKMMNSIAQGAIKHPTSFGVWATILQYRLFGIIEIVLTGEGCHESRKELLRYFIPSRVIMSASKPLEDFPLLRGKKAGNPNLIYLCKNYACLEPVETVAELLEKMREKGK